MVRVNTRIGDVFLVNIGVNSKKYFQYIANDLIQLNSDVIRVFKTIYPINTNPELSEILSGEIDFVAHCVIKFGLKMGLWEKIGNEVYKAKLKTLFRDTNDYGSKPGEQIKISNNWYVWKIGDTDFNRVGKLVGEYQKAEIGIVINPKSIVHRMQTGEYDFVYPDY